MAAQKCTQQVFQDAGQNPDWSARLNPVSCFHKSLQALNEIEVAAFLNEFEASQGRKHTEMRWAFAKYTDETMKKINHDHYHDENPRPQNPDKYSSRLRWHRIERIVDGNDELLKVFGLQFEKSILSLIEKDDFGRICDILENFHGSSGLMSAVNPKLFKEIFETAIEREHINALTRLMGCSQEKILLQLAISDIMKDNGILVCRMDDTGATPDRDIAILIKPAANTQTPPAIICEAPNFKGPLLGLVSKWQKATGASHIQRLIFQQKLAVIKSILGSGPINRIH